MIYIIGAGGAGSFALPMLKRLLTDHQITVVDGDKFEPSNMDRQLFNAASIGVNKAVTLAQQYDCKSIPEFFTLGRIDLRADDWLFVCVDNHAARRAAIESVDLGAAGMVSCQNEKTSASAFIYMGGWVGSRKDPRVRYPEIMTDRTGDPTARRIGCVAEINEGNTQLVSANFLAAGLMGQLATLWLTGKVSLPEDARKYLPIEMGVNMTSATMLRCVDCEEQTNE